jgi:hypothetical protein
MHQKEKDAYYLINIDSHKMLFARNESTRILQPYEYREVPGRIVKAIHLGNPLIDLNLLLTGRSSSMGNATIRQDGLGFLVDSVENVEINVQKVLDIDTTISGMKGNIIEAYLQTSIGTLPVLSIESVFTHGLLADIESEMKERQWI